MRITDQIFKNKKKNFSSIETRGFVKLFSVNVYEQQGKQEKHEHQVFHAGGGGGGGAVGGFGAAGVL